MTEIIISIILGVSALAVFVASIFSFNEKGFLFNNAYIFASPQEREKLNKKPLYRQTAVILLMISAILLLNAAEVLLKTGWLFYVVMAVAAGTLIFAIISSIYISKNSK